VIRNMLEQSFNYFKYFPIILIESTNYIFVHLLDNQVFLSSLIHGTNMRIKPILCYGSVTWTLTQTAEQMLNNSERKISRRILWPSTRGVVGWGVWNAGAPDGTVNCTVYTKPKHRGGH